MDPRYPGAVDKIINLGDFWNENILKEHKESIKTYSKTIHDYFSSAYRYLSAVKELSNDTLEILKPGIHYTRMNALADRLMKKNFPAKTGKKSPPNITRRFLTGITPFGIVNLCDRLPKSIENIFLFKDDYSIGSAFFERLAKLITKAGYDIVLCYCPLAPGKKIEHILVPELSIAFITSNESHTFDKKAVRTINLNRYIAPEILKQNKQKIRFNKKTTDLLLTQAIFEINKAKTLHDALESPYIESMDFTREESFRQKLVGVLLK